MDLADLENLELWTVIDLDAPGADDIDLNDFPR